MPERAVSFTFDTIVFVVLIAIVLILLSIIGINTMQVEEKSKFAGAPGVVRADAIKISYKVLSPTHKDLTLIMQNVGHEEGKSMTIYPVLGVSGINWLYRSSKFENGILVHTPYPIPGDIESYYPNVELPDDKLKDRIQITLWEASCLQKVGFVDRPSNFDFLKLIKECSGSYLASFYVVPERLVEPTEFPSQPAA